VSGEYSYAVPFEAYEAAGGQLLSSGPVTVTFDTVRLQGSQRCVLHDGEELEFLVGGTVLVESSVGVEQTSGNGRTVTEAFLEYQPSGGVFEHVGGSYGLVYTRNSTDGSFGSMRVAATLQVMAGSRIRVRAGLRSGSGTVNAVSDAVVVRATFIATNGGAL
jgi:hypothetical protein